MPQIKQLLLCTLILSFLSVAASAQSVVKLSPDEFEKKLQSIPGNQLVDVRTRGEFAKNRMPNAMNADYNSAEFEELLSHLDKNKPTFVYCFSGGRSTSAADIMQQKGFREVYELKGGLMQWKQADKPLQELEANASASKGMTEAEFNQMVKGNKLVLIDFGAKWCPPCRKLEPILEKISKDMNKQVSVISVDVDQNAELAKQKKVEALPVLVLYKNGQVVWQHNGFMDEPGLRQAISQHSAKNTGR
jgi:thioredoxin 1